MSKGWIKLHRELQDHWLWEGTKEFTKAQAWIDLLMKANHKSKKVMMDNELVKCDSGETITSETKLADRWGWSRTKVRSFIKLLESDDMLKKHTKNKRYTKLSICNYSTYQKQPTDKKQQKNNRKTTEKQQKNINKNEKNVKNEKKYHCSDDYKWDEKQPIDYISFVDKFNNLYDRQLRITDKKRKMIRGRLRNFTGKEILTAWHNRLKDQWLNGDGKEYLDNWNAAMRNGEKIEQYLTEGNSQSQPEYMQQL